MRIIVKMTGARRPARGTFSTGVTVIAHISWASYEKIYVGLFSLLRYLPGRPWCRNKTPFRQLPLRFSRLSDLCSS